ncbi:hypothetical protein [Streptomyces sp. CB01881]|uniref:hypothetical protein n=1 Tax=Streptomyces sp. CB01881 TaxID=2078691 RepID=UPI000CDC5547|nr:hypothetical protein [Streptomyces sp. CB01881]AUY48559.1 hypothetical protein C2142_05850 [Streptomyces sp. CB01881]TYC77050.1 hypothetical protein EH183_05860 [Streptomyces sp. CB01881]
MNDVDAIVPGHVMAPGHALATGAPLTTGEAFAAVERLADERATGALRGPTGTLHLADGLVVHAESDRAPDLAMLLTGCGRITRQAWQEAVRTYGPHGRVGGALVEQRLFTRGELELCQLGALYDAAFFVLDGAGASAGPWSFEPGARHWLGPVAAVSAPRLRREVERRHRLLDRIWPWPQLDTEPVRPLGRTGRTAEAGRIAEVGRIGEVGPPRPVRPAGAVGSVRPSGGQERCAAPGNRPGRPCPPSRRQRELLDHADGRRTPAELARLLGRSGFATTADVRRLAAAGLLATPGRDAPRHAAGSRSAAQAGPEPGVRTEAPPGTQSGPPPAPPPGPPPGLLRRVPGAALAGLLPVSAIRSARHRPLAVHPSAPAHPPGPAAARPPTVPDPDIALLIRVRTLLEARL